MIPNIKKGQALVELLIAIALSSILLPALLTGLVASREGKAQSGQRLQATALLKEAVEATRSIREKNFANISANGTYYPKVDISGTGWELAPGSETINGYTRQINVSNTERDSSGNIVESGGTIDNSTKKIVSSVSWTTPQTSSVTVTNYYQRYLGNAAFLHTTQAEFAAGTHNNTTAADVPNSVVLTQSPTGSTDYGNKFRTTATSSIGSMTSTGHKTSLRFTAQNTKTVNAIRVYLQTEVGASPSYRYGIQADAAGSPSGTYLGSGILTSTSTGWKTISLSPPASITAGTIYHIVVQYSSGTISNSRYIALRQSSPLNALYPQTNVADSNASTLFNSGSSWTTLSGQPIYELDYSDSTYEGNPYETNSEISVFGNNWYGEKFSFSGPDKTAQTVSFCVRKNGTPPSSLQVILRDDANSTIYSGVLTTSAATPAAYTCPGVWQTHTFSPAPITLTAGTAYRIIIQTSGGNNNNSYRFQRADTTSAANFNSITYDATTSIYTASANAGSLWTDTDSSDFGGFYFSVAGTTTYSSSGEFISHSADSFDTTVDNAAYNNITWTATIPAGTSLGLQIAASNSSSPASFVGPDGTPATSYTTSPATIMPFNAISGRYIRYKAIFTSNGSATPQLDDVSINYSP